MPQPILVNVKLPDALTASICAHLAAEFFKHIAYQRQQLPFPFKQLMSILSRSSRAEDENSTTPRLHTFQSIQAENEYHRVNGILQSMETAFQNLENEMNYEEGQVEEIAMIFGATPVSPRDVYRIQFPPLLYGHLDSRHPPQSSLLQLFRCLISSEELHSFFSHPLSPTNMFLLIRKRNSGLVTSGFTAKERYCIPSSGKHAIIRLIPPTDLPKCICGGSNIYQDCKIEDPKAELPESEQLQSSVIGGWYQSLNSFKGFRDVKINGTTASTMWLQSR